MDLDNIQRKYGLPAPLPVVQNGKFATRFPLNLEHRGDDVFQFGGKYIGEIENIYDLLYKILTNQEIDASLALPYAIKITEDKLYIRDKTNSEWITIFDITKPNFPKEIELYELIYKAITHKVIGEDTSYPGQFKIEENILYVRDKDNLTWTQIGDVTKEFLGATEATQAILDQVNEILTEVQELKTELNRQIATTNETLTTALQAANEAMTSAQSINIRTFNSVEDMKASNTLKAGALAKTIGFYTAGDGGGADYVVTDNIGEDEANEISIITLKNELYAKLLIQEYVNVKWFGAHGDNEHDDTQALQKALDFSVKNGYTTNFTKDTYLITDTLVINNGNGYFKGIEGKGATLRYPNIENKPAISIQYGSGDIKEQDIYNLIFVGSETSTGIEIKGAGGIYPINCYFAKNKYGVVFSNDVSAGTFTEGNIVIRCRFTSDCETAIYYYKGNGNSSFHGSGLRDCWIDTKADVPTIKIDEGAMPYNAPLSFRLLKPEGSKAIIENLGSGITNFFGAITTEGEIITLAEGNAVYFTGTINALGLYKKGSLETIEEFQRRGAKSGNVTAFKRKREVRKYTFSKNEKISVYFPAGTIEIRQGSYYHILTIANLETGYSPRIQSPIQTLNPEEIEKLNITFTDGTINFTPNYDGGIYLVLNYGVSPSNHNEVLDYEG